MQTILGQHWHHLDARQVVELLDTSRDASDLRTIGKKQLESSWLRFELASLVVA